MSKFSALKTQPRAQSVTAAATKGDVATGGRSAKKPVMGYYSPLVNKTLSIMALEENTTLQALLGEAIDLLMRERGKHPFGER